MNNVYNLTIKDNKTTSSTNQNLLLSQCRNLSHSHEKSEIFICPKLYVPVRGIINSEIGPFLKWLKEKYFDLN